MADESLKIIEYPDDRLKVVCKPIETITPELKKLSTDMYKLMKDAKGIGLSAPQVGLDIQMIVIEDHGYPLVMLNPFINKRSKSQRFQREGCLSFPDLIRLVKRPDEIIVKYLALNGQIKHEIFKGQQAQVILHECEHLRGILLIDHIEKSKK